MQPTPGVFTGKLCELERQYGDAVDRLRLYQQADHEQVRRELPAYLHGENTCRDADRAEAASLYGEYAIDFAAQAVRHALLAALSAIDLQMSCDEATLD